MKSEISLFIFIIFVNIVGTAPIAQEDEALDTVILNRIPQEDINRDKRSKYVMQYMPPCAGAAGSVPAATPLHPAYAPDNYHYNVPNQPYHGSYATPQNYAYSPQHYRFNSMEAEPEMLRFSDMDNDMPEQLPMSRYVAYAPGVPNVDIHARPTIAPAAPAGVVGLLPNAHMGDCNVPLIFSCTPSVVPGRLVSLEPHYGASAAVNSYRGVNDQFPLESHEILNEASSNIKPTKVSESTNKKTTHT